LRKTALSADRRLLYLDSSALVKLVIHEPESEALAGYLSEDDLLVTSRLALVEVSRATKLANPGKAVERETDRRLRECALVDVSDHLLRQAASLTSRSIRTLDAIHLASAAQVRSDELVTYDRRLTAGALTHGLVATAPGSE
jgi:predicted nucleic acid-binding protein